MIYQQTPDFYNEYISHSAVWEGRSRYRNGEDELEHGWAKDAAAKAHKYIDRWRGKNGKWYYRYKSKAQELGAKVRRKLNYYDDESTSYDIRKTPRLKALNSMSYVNSQSRKSYVGNLSGKASSYSGQVGSRKITTTKVSSKISRKPKKKGNLTSRGYSGSKGSGESQRQRNLGTRHSSRSIFNTTKDEIKIGRATATLNRTKRAKEYNEWRKNPQRMMAKDAILNKRKLGESDKYSANKGYKRGKKKKK